MIDADLVERFQRDGAVHIPQLFTARELADLRAGIDQNLAHLSPRAKVASSPTDPGRFVEDFCNWQDNPHYRRFIFESALAETAGRLMRSTSRSSLPRSHADQGARHAPADAVAPGPALLQHRRHAECELLDPRRSGEPRIHPGIRCRLAPRTLADAALVHGLRRRSGFPKGLWRDLPDIEARRSDFPILGWALDPGDAVCFHMLTLHAARGVEGDRRRRVFSVRFLGDDIVHAPRRWKTSPDFPGLENELPAGAPMNHPLFPELWRAA